MMTIGVLGGVGPQATMDLEARLHHVAQGLIPQMFGGGHPPLVVVYLRRAPFVLKEDYTPVVPLQADPDLLRAAHWLGEQVDFLLISSNGPHLVQEQIEQAAGCKVLSMIETTLKEVRLRGWRKIGVLAFGDPQAGVYTQPLSQMGLSYEIIDMKLQAPLNEAIRSVMEGREDASSAAAARQAVKALREKPVDGIILGCTELPLLLPDHTLDGDLINPAQLLAEAAIRLAME